MYKLILIMGIFLWAGCTQQEESPVKLEANVKVLDSLLVEMGKNNNTIDSLFAVYDSMLSAILSMPIYVGTYSTGLLDGAHEELQGGYTFKFVDSPLYSAQQNE